LFGVYCLVRSRIIAHADMRVEIYTSGLGERVVCVNEAALAAF
jgi:hypothetical protein